MFVNFTPENLKHMAMTAEHGNFPLFQTKVIKDIVVLYSFSNNGVKFFILHNINMEIFLTLADLPSQFPFCRFVIAFKFHPKKLKSTAIMS